MPGPGAAVKALTNTPEGTRFRAQLFNIPGADFQPEFTEFTSLDRHASKPRMQDPGPAMLTLEVRDIKPKLDVALKESNPRIRVYGVEPIGAASMRKSLDAGRALQLDSVSSIASSPSRIRAIRMRRPNTPVRCS